MISVQGLELNRALALLEANGYSVRCIEVSSRKGVAGNEKRVIRQRECNGVIELAYSVFKTDQSYNA